jgi:hypothetical protein
VELNGMIERFKQIDIDLLVKADWNYKEEDADLQIKLENNIKRNGQIENIIVRLLDTGFYEVVNGNHRYDAFKKLGFKKIICCDLGKISRDEAVLQAVATNETKFKTIESILYERIKELGESYSLKELSDVLPYDEKMLEVQMKAVDFDFNNYNDKNEENEENFNNDIVSDLHKSSSLKTISYNLNHQIAEQFEQEVIRIFTLLNENDNKYDNNDVFSIICQKIMQVNINDLKD